MLGHLHHDFIRYGGDICTGLGSLDDMERMADAGCDDLCGDVVDGKDLSYIPDQLHAVMADIIQPPQEGAYICSSGPGTHQCLCWGEDQSQVGLDPLTGKDLSSLQAFGCHRYLDDHIG